MNNNENNYCWNVKGIYGTGNCELLKDIADCKNCGEYVRTGKKYLNRPIPDDFLKEWTKQISSDKIIEDDSSISVIVFRIYTEWYALRTSSFQEIIPLRSVHYIPHRTNNIFKGIVNVQGELLLCFSINNVLSIEYQDEITNNTMVPRMVVTNDEKNKRYVFKADEVKGIFHIAKTIIKDIPSTLSKAAFTYTEGLIESDNLHIGLINELKLFNAFNRSLS